MGIRPQQAPIPTSKIAQHVLDQTQMINQDVRRSSMQAYINFIAFYDKKANTSQLKDAVYVYVLQRKADHQGSKILFTEFRWIGPYIIENCCRIILSGMQNWHQQDASASSHSNASIHTATSPT